MCRQLSSWFFPSAEPTWGFNPWPPEVKITSEHAEVGGGSKALALFESGASDASSAKPSAHEYLRSTPAVLVEIGPTRRLVDLDGFGLNV